MDLDEFFTLDVGCGDAPCGDVNVDLYLNDTEGHRTLKHQERYKINPKLVPNFVVCDGSYLPFKDECFDFISSRQVIEHVPKPELMAYEMVRCSKNIVVIETVHRRGERLNSREMRKWLNKHHINKFDYTYFGQLAKMLKVNLVWNEALDYLGFRFLGYNLPFIRFPFGIRIIYCKVNTDWGVLKNRKLNPKRRYLEGVGL